VKVELSLGSIKRLQRIRELKNCSEYDALQYAVSVGWLIAEQRAIQNEKKVSTKLRSEMPSNETTSNLENIQSTLKGAVTTLLVTEHDFSIDDAEESVNESFESKPELWHENAEAKDLANFLASDDGDE
jgi:hypothetical protein